MSVPWSGHFRDFGFIFLCFIFVIPDAAAVLDFPGPSTCLDDGIELSKPENFFLSTWKRLHVVDATGGNNEACDLHPEGSTMIIPEECIDYQGGRKIAYVSIKNLVYKISCHDYQADSLFERTIVECGDKFITANISRTLPGFSDEGPTKMTWKLKILPGGTIYSLAEAGALGYHFTYDLQYLNMTIGYNAKGITSRNGNSYSGDVQLLLVGINPIITIDVKIRCVQGPFTCNKTYMFIPVPPLDGVLESINIDEVEIPIQNATQLLSHGLLMVDNSSGTFLLVKTEKLKVVQSTDPRINFTQYLPPLILSFLMDGVDVESTPNVAIGLVGSCVVLQGPPFPYCTPDGFMIIAVVSSLTKPSLDLDTVVLRNSTKSQCLPVQKTKNMVLFNFSVTMCGTERKFEGGKLIYENEVHALWKYPPRISRDSELRETVRCVYNISDQLPFVVSVRTPSPPLVSERYDGPISFVLNLYQDVSYEVLYQDNQYPVVKTLRDPIYLEVQVLNRNDENIELVLNDCWATMSPDPTSSPQWNVVVDGCQENKDDYLTVFHEVTNVALPQHRKRFEVKAFEFVLGGDVTTNLVFFHCSALICQTQAPDYPLCTKSCQISRMKRDELFLNRHSELASLPGPLLFVDSDPAMALQDEYSTIKEITLGVLPAFGIVAVVILAVVLVSKIKRKANH